MVTDLILVCMMCGCNMYVIPRSVSRTDFGYKGYEVSYNRELRRVALPAVLT